VGLTLSFTLRFLPFAASSPASPNFERLEEK